MENQEVIYNGKIGEEQLELLKSQHGKVMTIEVPENDEGTVVAVGYLKKPSRQTMGLYLSLCSNNIIRAREILLADTWVGGDERIKTDDDLFYSAGTVLGEVITVRQAELKKN